MAIPWAKGPGKGPGVNFLSNQVHYSAIYSMYQILAFSEVCRSVSNRIDRHRVQGMGYGAPAGGFDWVFSLQDVSRL
jgi:hypothetical protein